MATDTMSVMSWFGSWLHRRVVLILDRIITRACQDLRLGPRRAESRIRRSRPNGRQARTVPAAAKAIARWSAASRISSGDLDRSADRHRTDGRHRRLFDDAAHLDRELGRPMEDQHAVVGEQDRRRAARRRGPDVRDRLLRTARTIGRDGHAVREAEHGESLDPAVDGPSRDREGGGERRMGMHDAADLGVVLVERRVHRDHRTLDRRQRALTQGAVETDADDVVRPYALQRWRGGEVHLVAIAGAKTHIAVPVDRDRSARGDPPRRLDHPGNEGCIHVPILGSRALCLAAVRWASAAYRALSERPVIAARPIRRRGCGRRLCNRLARRRDAGPRRSLGPGRPPRPRVRRRGATVAGRGRRGSRSFPVRRPPDPFLQSGASGPC